MIPILEYVLVEVIYFLITGAKSNDSYIQRSPERALTIYPIVEIPNSKPALGKRIRSDEV